MHDPTTLDECSCSNRYLTGHSAPVLAVAFTPDDDSPIDLSTTLDRSNALRRAMTAPFASGTLRSPDVPDHSRSPGSDLCFRLCTHRRTDPSTIALNTM